MKLKPVEEITKIATDHLSKSNTWNKFGTLEKELMIKSFKLGYAIAENDMIKEFKKALQ